MNDIERLLQRLSDAEPDPRLMQFEDAVMGRIALLPDRESGGGTLRWGAVTAVVALFVGTATGSLYGTDPSSAQTLPLVSTGLALAPSTLLASAP